MPSRWAIDDDWYDEDGKWTCYYVSQEVAIQMYDARVEMAKKLPKRCAGAIRTLRYVALADEGPDLEYEVFKQAQAGLRLKKHQDWDSADERYGGGADEYEYQGEWYDKKVKSLQWWRVERCVKKKWRTTKLRPLTKVAGEAVQRFLEEAADMETIERIDEFLP
ncbi:hypothetical protein BD309DRAFT_1018678 [Dichomitus squalens]|uniref:Uncharacterized protein n=1 Tax=Dichomitus squalens TaxID=114155 RepID=A0A4Q9QC55_9APHY|nr:hypothetical protein BD309DRAFT_1018678 [Dichomitus squalens]TBU65195.1 hypothetical protein BD310DRAFT_305671 [Dichomitus squalens]